MERANAVHGRSARPPIDEGQMARYVDELLRELPGSKEEDE